MAVRRAWNRRIWKGKSKFDNDAAALFPEEIRNASDELPQNVLVPRKPVVTKGTRRRTKPEILIDFFETVWEGTKQRKKPENQTCCICGAITIWRGLPTGHRGAHSRYGD